MNAPLDPIRLQEDAPEIAAAAPAVQEPREQPGIGAGAPEPFGAFQPATVLEQQGQRPAGIQRVQLQSRKAFQ